MNAEIQAIAEYYGVTSQQNKTIEEMAELIQALIKGDREAMNWALSEASAAQVAEMIKENCF